MKDFVIILLLLAVVFVFVAGGAASCSGDPFGLAAAAAEKGKADVQVAQVRAEVDSQRTDAMLVGGLAAVLVIGLVVVLSVFIGATAWVSVRRAEAQARWYLPPPPPSPPSLPAVSSVYEPYVLSAPSQRPSLPAPAHAIVPSDDSVQWWS